ncbi:hypothetical protein DFH07DRAFT_1055127 [Mycena maculata]|uniref:AAA-ATPase-like domain-containing protein n=1 Tax=Mycena maculata TaxID=230809 RepID=A0AAD7KBN4_9AGAR|nr:hypothetical protein DFH07DRAFT_1055127 [Mycena maculata]
MATESLDELVILEIRDGHASGLLVKPLHSVSKTHGDAFDATSSPPSTPSTGSTRSKRHWLWSDDEDSSSDGEPDQKRKRGSLSPISLGTSSGRPSLTGSDHRLRVPRFRDKFLDYRPGPSFVDKTESLFQLPDQFRYLLLRPPKFGKTAFLSTLIQFYDIHGAEQFTERFGALAVAAATGAPRVIPRHNQHLCLSLTLADIYVHVDIEELASNLATHFFAELQVFLVRYAAELKLSDPRTYLMDEADDVFGRVFDVVKASGHTLFVSIDAYDALLLPRSFAFLHYPMMQKHAGQRDIEHLLDSCLWGPLLAGSEVIDKLFVTGTLSFQSSAFKNLHLSVPNLPLCCGFTEQEALQFARSILDETTPEKANIHRSCGDYIFPSHAAGTDFDEPVLHPQRLISRISEISSGRPQDNDYSFQLLSDLLQLLPAESDVPNAATLNGLIELLTTGAVEVDGPLDAAIDLDGSSVFWSALYHAGALTYDHGSKSTLRVASSEVLSLIHSRIDDLVNERHELQQEYITALFNYDMEDDPNPLLELLSEVLFDQTQRSLGRKREPDLRGVLELVMRNTLCKSSARPIDPIILLPPDACVPIVVYRPNLVQHWELKTLTLLGMWRATNLNDEEPTVEALRKLHEELIDDDDDQLLARPYRVWSPSLHAMETVTVGSFLDPEPINPQFVAVGGARVLRRQRPDYTSTLLVPVS